MTEYTHGVTTQPLRKYDSPEKNNRVITFGGTVVEVERKETAGGDSANGHDYVEIGGIKWATMSIGADNETDYGLYFQWGDTLGYRPDQIPEEATFMEDDYIFFSGTWGEEYSKYNSDDDKTTLDLSDDAARANWGGKWRMPTAHEFLVLLDSTNASWFFDYNGSGVNGLQLVDKNNSSNVLFFPAAGIPVDGSISYENIDGYYYSSSLVPFAQAHRRLCYSMKFSNEEDLNVASIINDTYNRFGGMTIRGVLDTPVYNLQRAFETAQLATWDENYYYGGRLFKAEADYINRFIEQLTGKFINVAPNIDQNYIDFEKDAEGFVCTVSSLTYSLVTCTLNNKFELTSILSMQNIN